MNSDSDMVRFKIIFALILLLIISPDLKAGICTSGTSGLINIPTARVINDKRVVVGMGYVNNKVAYISNGVCDNFPFYITIGYLPRLEFSAGVVFIPGRRSYDGTSTYKDGIISLQYLLLQERKWLPAMAFGARDIYSYILLNTSYITFSKSLIKQKQSTLKLHFGYGSDIIDKHVGVPPWDRKRPVGHTIIGLFGGIEFNWNKSIVYMMEFDTQKINSGFRFRLNPFIELEIDLYDMSEICGGLNVHFNLPRNFTPAKAIRVNPQNSLTGLQDRPDNSVPTRLSVNPEKSLFHYCGDQSIQIQKNKELK